MGTGIGTGITIILFFIYLVLLVQTISVTGKLERIILYMKRLDQKLDERK